MGDQRRRRSKSQSKSHFHIFSAILSGIALMVFLAEKYLPQSIIEAGNPAKEFLLYLSLFIAIAAIFVGTMAFERQRHWEKRERYLTIFAIFVSVLTGVAIIMIIASGACSGIVNVY
jgi:hypothetical protein